MAELEEVVIEFALLDVENVVLDQHKVFHGFGELDVDLHDVGSHRLALGITNFNLLQLAELRDCTSQVHDVLAALGEGVKTHKQGIGGDLPLVLRLAFVLKVGVLEFGADVESKRQLLVRIEGLFVLDGLEDLAAVNSGATLLNDRVADLSDEHHKSRGRVVILRVVPDEQNGVHNGHEVLSHLREVFRCVAEIVE